MTEKEFYNTIVSGASDAIELVVAILTKFDLPFCIIGGLAVNAYAEPVISMDFDIAVASKPPEKLLSELRTHLTVKEFPHRINIAFPNSSLRVQLQTDNRYRDFPRRASVMRLLGHMLPVACIEDLLKSKIWAYSDPERRKSKRQKDLSDIMRLVEAHQELEKILPDDIRKLL